MHLIQSWLVPLNSPLLLGWKLPWNIKIWHQKAEDSYTGYKLCPMQKKIISTIVNYTLHNLFLKYFPSLLKWIFSLLPFVYLWIFKYLRTTVAYHFLLWPFIWHDTELFISNAALLNFKQVLEKTIFSTYWYHSCMKGTYWKCLTLAEMFFILLRYPTIWQLVFLVIHSCFDHYFWVTILWYFLHKSRCYDIFCKVFLKLWNLPRQNKQMTYWHSHITKKSVLNLLKMVS